MLVVVVDPLHYGMAPVSWLCSVGDAVPVLVKWSIVMGDGGGLWWGW